MRSSGGFAFMGAAAAMLLSGCVSSPTYGTGKSANAQLFNDLTSMVSIAPKHKDSIDYKPRPDLVKSEDPTTLPAPQDPILTAGNPAWPESPEERRQRLRAEATANQDNPAYVPKIKSGSTGGGGIQSGATLGERGNFENVSLGKDTREEYKRRLAERNQGSDTKRKYLSEPPIAYRAPADTAPVNDVGEDEAKKKARREAEARKKSDGFSLKNLIPWL